MSSLRDENLRVRKKIGGRGGGGEKAGGGKGGLKTSKHEFNQNLPKIWHSAFLKCINRSSTKLRPVIYNSRN